MERKWYELFTKDSRCFILGTREAVAQRMLDFDFICGRDSEEASVAAFVGDTAGSRWLAFGTKSVEIPVYTSVKEAADKHPDVEVVLNYQSFRSAFKSSLEALAVPSIRVLAIIAEGMPEKQTKLLIKKAEEKGQWVIGPATVGGIAAGKFRIGNSGGTIENIIISKLHRPGSVGYTGVSGGLFNEIANMIARYADGVYEAFPVGGDTFPGSTMLDHLLRYEANPEIKFMVLLGELGRKDEYDIAQALRDGRLTKPLVAWVCGTCQKYLPPRTQFGHAGAKASQLEETAEAKNMALAEAGAVVPNSFDELPEKIKEVYLRLKKNRVIKRVVEPKVRQLPMDLAEAQKKGLVRVPPLFHSTISDERGETLRYAGYSVVEMIEKGYGIEDVVSLLWFKRFPQSHESEIIKRVIMLLADNGPCVSGATVDIYNESAGIDMVHSVASAISCIGPLFGGAITDAAQAFSEALAKGMTAKQFIRHHKLIGPIPGIGHRLFNKDKPDSRRESLIRYIRDSGAPTPHLDFALEVEKLTLEKRDNLILNVDGTVGMVLLDLGFPIESLNAFFLLARTIGFIGHWLDQKRQNTRLIRTPAYLVDYRPEPPREVPDKKN